jgi:hypothetical protein
MDATKIGECFSLFREAVVASIMAEGDPAESKRTITAAINGINIVEQVVLDIHRIADAMEKQPSPIIAGEGGPR